MCANKLEVKFFFFKKKKRFLFHRQMEFEPEWGLLLPLPLAEEDCVKTAANQPRLVSGSSQAYWAMEGIFSEKKRGGHSPSSTSEVLLSKSRWGFVHNEPKWGGSRGADANLTPSLQYATPFRHRGQQLRQMNKIVPFNNICHDFFLCLSVWEGPVMDVSI